MPRLELGRAGARSLLATIGLFLVLVVGGCENIPSTVDTEETDPAFQVPGGSSARILKFARNLQQDKTLPSDPAKASEQVTKKGKALIRAGDKLLQFSKKDAALSEATSIKIMGHAQLAFMAANDPVAPSTELSKELYEIVAKLRHDPRASVAKSADRCWVIARAFNLPALSDDERNATVDDAIKSLDNGYTVDSYSESMILAEQLIRLKNFERAAALIEQVAKAVMKSGQQSARSDAARLVQRARNLRLCGKPLALSGRQLNGADFNWNSYRGKVVLVDFWATWCSPCVSEMRYLTTVYDKFHDQGFEVIGISLDDNRQVLQDFLNSEKIPWVQLYDDAPTQSADRHHPMVRKYGISTIPAAFLVDQNGIVVTVEARGVELAKMIEKQLSSKE